MRLIKENIVWYDLYPSTDEEIDFLGKSFELNSSLIEELKNQSPRQKIEKHQDFIFLVIRFPIYNESKKTCTPVEINFLIKEKEVATIRYENCQPIDEFFKNAEELEGFKKKYFDQTTAEFLNGLFGHLFSYANRELAHIDKEVNLITDKIFKGKEKEMIKQLSVAKRDILDFRRIMKPIQGLLKSLAGLNQELYQENKSSLFDQIYGLYLDTIDLAENQKDTIDSLEATNSSLLSSKLDEVTKILSWLAFLLAPFTIIGTLFQINTQFTPIIGKPADWYIITGITLVCSFGLYLIMKKKNWL
ncbi:MAG: CorA family divalent cation transporter [Patescibacteria group bacterium]